MRTKYARKYARQYARAYAGTHASKYDHSYSKLIALPFNLQAGVSGEIVRCLGMFQVPTFHVLQFFETAVWWLYWRLIHTLYYLNWVIKERIVKLIWSTCNCCWTITAICGKIIRIVCEEKIKEICSRKERLMHVCRFSQFVGKMHREFTEHRSRTFLPQLKILKDFVRLFSLIF